MPTESQAPKATQWIHIITDDNSKYCFPVTRVLLIVTFSLVLKTLHLKEEGPLRHSTCHTLTVMEELMCFSIPMPPCQDRAPCDRDLQCPHLQAGADLSEVCHNVCHSLGGFCRQCFFSCLKQLVLTLLSPLSLISRISTACLPIFFNKL